jgi:hypothetical protein
MKMSYVATKTSQAMRQDSTGRHLDQFVKGLDARIQQLLAEIEQTAVWRAVTSPDGDPMFIRLIMRELYLEIYSYQSHVIEAAIAAIGQMPRSIEPRLIRAMLCHQSEEFDHGEMALRDYIALGGDEQSARRLRPSPASFAVSAAWWMIVKLRDPFAYLGALYPFEGLTPIITDRVKPYLLAKGMAQSSLGFIEFHSTEDLKHTRLVRHVLKGIVEQFPDSVDSIKYGMECFLAVYPLPVWNSAYESARLAFNCQERPK